ncbi:MAG: sigma-70 family RNA polymerase sigma factor [Clostridiales bacterium]|nr:sigma-70 family RNA polymerase sigma factor [Clostridiales bacterium]
MHRLSNLTEAELLSLAQRGNNEAAGFIIEKYKALVEAIVKKYTLPDTEFDDFVQEGMIGLLAAIESFDSRKGSKFSTYCYTCIQNSVMSALRKVQRKKDIPKASIISLDDEAAFQQTTVLSAEDSFIERESAELLKALLDERLSAFEKSVLEQKALGKSYEEIGAALGKDVKAVDNAVQRMRKKLVSLN